MEWKLKEMSQYFSEMRRFQSAILKIWVHFYLEGTKPPIS